MSVTRIKNNQIFDATVNAATKLVDYSITSGKIANNLVYGSDLTISGNLSVLGNTTTIDTVNLTVEDPLILLAKEQVGSPALDIGFIGKRGTSTNIAFVWDESAGQFVAVYTPSEVTNTTVVINSYASMQVLDLTARDANLSGNISITGNVLTSLNVNGNLTGGNISTAGSFSASGNVTGSNVLTGGVVSATGNVTGGNLRTAGVVSATGNVAGGNLTTAGAVSATGNITGGNLSGTSITGTTVSATGNITGGNLSGTSITGTTVSASGNVTGGNLNTAGVVSATGNITGGNLSGTSITGTTVSASGNVTGGNLNTAGIVSATGNITGGNLSGTSITGTTVSASGNVTGGNVLTGGMVSAVGNMYAANFIGNFAGNVDAAGSNTWVQFNDADILGASAGFTFDKTSNLLTVAGTVQSGNLQTTGIMSATGNVTGGNLRTAGVVSATGNVTGGNVSTAGVVSATGNVTGGNVSTAGVVSATGNVTGGNVLTGGVVSAVGNITGGNLKTTGEVAGGTLAISGDAVVTGNLAIQGNLTYINVETLRVEDPLIQLGTGPNGAPLTTNDGKDRGLQLEYYTTAAGTAWMGWDNSTGYMVAASNVTVANDVVTVNSYGTFKAGDALVASLSTTGNVTGGNVLTGGLISATGNVAGGNLTTAGVVSATGNVTGGNLITAGVVSATGNVTGGNLTTAGVVSATGNVTGGNLNTAGVVSATGNITGGNLAGTSITGTTVSASGNVTGGNLTTAGLITATGNVTGGNLTTAGLITATGNVTGGNLTTAGLITATGNVTGGNVLTGGIVSATGNVTGGNLRTTGVVSATGNITGGNLSGTSITGTTVSASGNVTGGNVLTGGVVSATGNITGGNLSGTSITGTTVSASGNVTGGNLNTAGVVSATGNITGGNLSGTSITGTTVSASGNVTGGNVLTGGLISATGNVTGGNLATAGTANLGNIVISGDNITGTNGVVTVNAAGADVDFRISGDTQANLLVADAGSDSVLISTGTPITGSALTIGTTNSMLIPVGNTQQRPTGVTGMVRFNTTLDNLEFYDSNGWTIAKPDSTIIADDKFTGDGSTVVFTLSQNATTNSVIVSINGVLQIPTDAYSVSTNQLTFTEAPLSTDTIDVRILTTTSVVTGLTNNSGNATFTASETSSSFDVKGSLMPTANITYNMGNTSTRWNDSYFVNVNAQAFNNLSDRVLKGNVTPITNADQVVNALQGVGYDWVDGTGHAYGFIAQDVEQVIPDAVTTGDDNIKSINYAMIIPFLVELVKKQGQEIAELKQMINK